MKSAPSGLCSSLSPAQFAKMSRYAKEQFDSNIPNYEMPSNTQVNHHHHDWKNDKKYVTYIGQIFADGVHPKKKTPGPTDYTVSMEMLRGRSTKNFQNEKAKRLTYIDSVSKYEKKKVGPTDYSPEKPKLKIKGVYN